MARGATLPACVRVCATVTLYTISGWWAMGLRPPNSLLATSALRLLCLACLVAPTKSATPACVGLTALCNGQNLLVVAWSMPPQRAHGSTPICMLNVSGVLYMAISLLLRDTDTRSLCQSRRACASISSRAAVALATALAALCGDFFCVRRGTWVSCGGAGE